jgi:3-deoxy-manno-octulosonate cytidylyltransferase (CMP-KDO synthetase)
MSFTIVIPARFASTRLPGKPLLPVAGKPMIQHVWERARCAGAGRVLIATDDARIEEACLAFGAEVMMTDAAHKSGTDRLAEVARRLRLTSEEIVVNVQGDEPLIPPPVIEQVAHNLARHDTASIATLCEGIRDEEQLIDPNAVKVVRDREGFALYFSRAPIPYPRDRGLSSTQPLEAGWWRHLGIYGYRAGFLARFSTWEPAALERCESLEQLRALYQGERIHVDVACAAVPGGVDTPEDLARLRTRLGDETPS